jgi:hypothetical protein
MAPGDWSHGLTLAGAAASGLTVCASAIREEFARDLRSLKQRRDRPI